MTAPPLPPAREGPYAIALVCLGNICRSPMAEVVLQDRLVEAGLDERVRLTSGGTGPWHVGDPMDERAASTLRGAGLDPSRHRGRQVDATWFESHDLVLAMDHSNRDDLAALAPPTARDRLLMFRAFDPEGGPTAEVPDPWYGGPEGFDQVLSIIERTAAELTAALSRHLSP